MPSELYSGGSGTGGGADPAAEEDSVPAWVVGVVLVPILVFACVAIIYFKCAQDYFRRRNDPGASFDGAWWSPPHVCGGLLLTCVVVSSSRARLSPPHVRGGLLLADFL